jgi:hypothetical protein
VGSIPVLLLNSSICDHGSILRLFCFILFAGAAAGGVAVVAVVAVLLLLLLLPLPHHSRH